MRLGTPLSPIQTEGLPAHRRSPTIPRSLSNAAQLTSSHTPITSSTSPNLTAPSCFLAYGASRHSLRFAYRGAPRYPCSILKRHRQALPLANLLLLRLLCTPRLHHRYLLKRLRCLIPSSNLTYHHRWRLGKHNPTVVPTLAMAPPTKSLRFSNLWYLRVSSIPVTHDDLTMATSTLPLPAALTHSTFEDRDQPPRPLISDRSLEYLVEHITGLQLLSHSTQGPTRQSPQVGWLPVLKQPPARRL